MRDDFHSQVFLVAKAVRRALDDTDGVVQPLDAAQRDFVLGLAIGDDALPMPLDHTRELLERCQPLPAQTARPGLEEASCPTFAFVVPEWAEGLLEQVGGVEPFGGGQQRVERLPTLQRQVVAVRQLGVAAALDEAPRVTLHPGVFAPAHRLQGLVQMAQDVELVEHDLGVRRVLAGRLAKRLPHVQHRHLNPLAAPRPVGREERFEIGLLASRAAEPDRSRTNEVADHHAVLMPLADSDLVHADRRGGRPRVLAQLLSHVQLVQVLDGGVRQSLGQGDVLDGHLAAQRAHMPRIAGRVARVTGQPVQGLHANSAVRTAYADTFPLKLDTKAAGRKIPRARQAPIIDRAARPAPARADAGRFLRRNRTTRTSGSPKTPWSCAAALNPGNEYHSHNVRARFIGVPHSARSTDT